MTGMTQTIALASSPLVDPLPEVEAVGRPSFVLRPHDFAHWEAAFETAPDHTDLVLEPGDYRDWGTCVIRQGNRAGHRRLVRFVDPAKRPWERIGDEALTQGFQFASGASHWAVHGLTIRGPDLAGSVVRRGAEHITFDSLLIEDVDRVNTIRLVGNHCTVQQCVIRRAWSPTHDVIAVLIAVDEEPNVGNRVLDNEIYDCGDGVGVTWDDHGPDPYQECLDLVVEGNDIYLTEARHIQRATRIYATAENGIDIKAGPRTRTQPLEFVHNRIWGFRTPEPGSAQRSDGAAVTIHRGAQRLLFAHNVIFDCPIAFHEVVRDLDHPVEGVGKVTDPRQGDREVTLRSNIISFMHPYNPEDAGAILRTRLPFRLERNWFSHSGTLSALPKVSPTHDMFMNNVLHEDTPLGAAVADWKAGSNCVPPAADMRDVLIERCRWTNPGLVRLRSAVFPL
ncbi:hypothetical protein GCM10020358_38580 [Amorphoplanes nipponensis]|uniref:Right handed beta helix region n=1 Tax=Actinoplanes nipponensis TaxID=135950 RepID=A0A919JFC0_9ACTN|nr:hypothetical protein [Actinoplanes nipponensis]GIE48285.1 hypothetical protein Ani05nite_18190 [Actinoplanes nipponensis]